MRKKTLHGDGDVVLCPYIEAVVEKVLHFLSYVKCQIKIPFKLKSNISILHRFLITKTSNRSMTKPGPN